ncbi:MAG: hypothetical protein IT436_04930 [Phycisphaerales bacterium]|nr:hypothetical protein [Phycisphaerales bacterium]
MNYHRKNLLAMASCGLVGGLATIASAQPYVVNISGATLLENYVAAPASTHDAIDVDGDGIITSGGIIDQLSPSNPPSASNWWVIQYRATGSIRGLRELFDYGDTFLTLDEAAGPLKFSVCSRAFCNRSRYINGGVAEGIKNLGNPGAAPVRSSMDGNYVMQYSVPDLPSAGGIQIDIAVLDVPSPWGLCYPGGTAGVVDYTPGEGGYGCNPLLADSKSGTPTTFGNKLVDIAAPANTFDTALFFAPIATVVNLGVGLEQTEMSNLQYIFTTGRTNKGENLMVATRDSGSGTRNGYMNCIGIDPSYGVGDNIGTLSSLADWDRLGADFQPTNKNGNGQVEGTVINHRLGIGYVGAERGVAGAWLTGGRMEVLAIRNDIIGGTEYSRPNIDEILDNTINGYVIGGPASLVTLGNPQIPGSMNNPSAAAYVNNIRESIADVTAAPGSDPTVFTPGELAATQFILTASQDFVHDLSMPTLLTPNADLNPVLQDFTRANNVLRNPAYYTFGLATRDGRVPTRKTAGSPVYSDGLTNTYITQGGATLTYGDPLPSRNRIAGDFDGNGLRNWNDATEMLKALRQREGGATWTAPAGSGPIAGAPGSDSCIEILGDFDGDGSFTRADVRYWADGLAVNPSGGALNRAEGFLRADNAASAAGVSLPLFATVLATGATYQPGDARADIAGAAGTAPGFAPVGSDGRIDARDIDYIFAQFRGTGDSEVNWSHFAETFGRDLSADITGDLKINTADVQAVLAILGTTQCDVNLDGVGDQADADIVTAHLGTAGGWADGDVNGDGQVDATDLAIVSACSCIVDLNGDGIVDFSDYLEFLNLYDAQDPRVDFNMDGIVDFSDYLEFLNLYDAGC